MLTEKAVELHKKAEKNIERSEKILKNGISDDELAIFYKVADKIKNNLEEENKC